MGRRSPRTNENKYKITGTSHWENAYVLLLATRRIDWSNDFISYERVVNCDRENEKKKKKKKDHADRGRVSHCRAPTRLIFALNTSIFNRFVEISI